MTDDDLVRRLRNKTRDSILKENDRREAADAIEQLTAERDANGKDYCALMERYDALVVNNARLREALTNVMGYVDTPISRRRLGIDPNACEWLLPARAALKGESHE